MDSLNSAIMADKNPNIEVTPQMLRAGSRAYFVADCESEEMEAVEAIYRAMERARLRKLGLFASDLSSKSRV